jgi:hypothetical protein
MQADRAHQNQAEGSRKSIYVPLPLDVPSYFRVHSCPFVVCFRLSSRALCVSVVKSG